MIGYGEATQASVLKVVDYFKLHGFDSTSAFQDIGSGFGKVAFDVAPKAKPYAEAMKNYKPEQILLFRIWHLSRLNIQTNKIYLKYSQEFSLFT